MAPRRKGKMPSPQYIKERPVNKSLPIIGLATLAICLASFAQTTSAPHELIAVKSTPKGVMDTDVELTAIVPAGQEEKGQKAVDAAEAVLRDIEKHMSAYREDAEIFKLNAAGANEEISLDPRTLEVLKISQEYTKLTGGVFDVTVRPVLQLWKTSAKAGHLPTDDQLKDALSLVGWDNFKLTDKGIIKLKAGCGIDLGGIAKKYGIDAATDAMIRQGAVGGLVNVGGDVRVFGRRIPEGKWRVGIKDPFDKDGKLITTMNVADGSVCTSGNYERFVVIDSKKYSHIVDARTGKPADAVPSVTVYGKTAVEAGIWGTALSVLGPEGLKLMPKDHGLEAMLITGTPEKFKIHYTGGFNAMPDKRKTESMPTTAQAGSEK